MTADPRFRDAWEKPRRRSHSRGAEDSPPAPPVGDTQPPASPWAGVTLFSAHDPRVAWPLLPYVDTVVLKGDGGDQAHPDFVRQFHNLGVRVCLWFSWDLPEPRSYWSVVRPQIGQAEGPGQRGECEANNTSAVITNVTFTDDPWLARYECVFTECYLNVNPAATQAALEYEAVKRGARFVVPTYAVYDGASEQAGGRKVPLAEYLAKHSGPSMAIYTVEYMDAADVEALRQWRQVHPRVGA